MWLQIRYPINYSNYGSSFEYPVEFIFEYEIVKWFARTWQVCKITNVVILDIVPFYFVFTARITFDVDLYTAISHRCNPFMMALSNGIQPSDPCRMLKVFELSGPGICCPMFFNAGFGGIDIFKVKLTFEMLTVHGQQHSFVKVSKSKFLRQNTHTHTSVN